MFNNEEKTIIKIEMNTLKEEALKQIKFMKPFILEKNDEDEMNNNINKAKELIKNINNILQKIK